MTVGGGGGTKTDFGTIGFDHERANGGQLLIFPKSLRRFSGARVIGIKFDLVQQPPLEAGSLAAPREKRAAPPASPAAASPRATAPAPVSDDANPRRRTPPPPRRRVPADHKPATPTPSATSDPQFLVREIKAALRELEAGKTVAAFKRLQRALEAGDH